MASTSSGDPVDTAMDVDTKPGGKGDQPVGNEAGEKQPESLPAVPEGEEPTSTPATDTPADPSTPDTAARTDQVSFKVIYNRNKYDVDFFLDETIGKLKSHLEKLISVPPKMQKIMVKGLAKDDKTLREVGVNPTAKVLVVGSTVNDVMSVSQPVPKKTASSEEKTTTVKEPLSEQKMHKKVITAGPPEEALPGIKNVKDSLPSVPLTGMVNRHGGRVRLTFKLELDQIWFGTKERTEKVNMNSIKAVVSEPIVGREEYHIMGFQLGPTEASRYWVYWVPAQYVDAIKRTVLGGM